MEKLLLYFLESCNFFIRIVIESDFNHDAFIFILIVFSAIMIKICIMRIVKNIRKFDLLDYFDAVKFPLPQNILFK